MSFGAVLAERLAAPRRRCQLKGDQSCRTIVPGSHVTVNYTNPPTSCSKWPSSDPGSQTASYAVSAPARVDAIILGAGISGLVAARILKQRGYEQIVVLDNRPQLGGNHISRDIGQYTFDIGTFLFQDDSPLMRHFPELLTAYVPASPSAGRVVPDRRICGYPLSPKNEIFRCGFAECVRIGCSLLWARLSVREHRNAQDFLHYWMGPRLARSSGIENYITRFYGAPAAEIDVAFAQKRMEAIANAASIRKQIAKLVGRKEPWHKGRSFVRPREGFQDLYRLAGNSLEADGVSFRLGEVFESISQDSNGLCLTTSSGKLASAALVSTIPVDDCLKLCNIFSGVSLPTMTLTTLFFSFDGVRGFTPTILYNFTARGLWKRITMYSDYYGTVSGREYFGVELNEQRGHEREAHDRVDLFAWEFARDVRELALFQGNLRLEGSHQLENAYPLYIHGASAQADKKIAALRSFGIRSIGRQGGFDYLPTARQTTLIVEEALLGSRGPLVYPSPSAPR
jgi:hypothetical protein